MKEMNNYIIDLGTLQGATKLSVITIGLGKVADLKELTIRHNGEDIKVVKHTEKGVEIATKEAPAGHLYDQSLDVVVRIIGGRVLIGGMYDMYCPKPDKIEKLLSNPIELDLTAEQQDELEPLFAVASKIEPSLAPEEPGRKVIIITDDLISVIGASGTDENGEYLLIRDEWDANPNSQLTKLYSGDVFLVSNPAQAMGYRIGGEEFFETHTIA